VLFVRVPAPHTRRAAPDTTHRRCLNLGDRRRGSVRPRDAAQEKQRRTYLSGRGEVGARGPRMHEGLRCLQTQCGGQCPWPRLQSIAPSPATPREPGRRVGDIRTVPGQRVRSRACASSAAPLRTCDRACRDCLFHRPDAQLLSSAWVCCEPRRCLSGASGAQQDDRIASGGHPRPPSLPHPNRSCNECLEAMTRGP